MAEYERLFYVSYNPQQLLIRSPVLKAQKPKKRSLFCSPPWEKKNQQNQKRKPFFDCNGSPLKMFFSIVHCLIRKARSFLYAERMLIKNKKILQNEYKKRQKWRPVFFPFLGCKLKSNAKKNKNGKTSFLLLN